MAAKTHRSSSAPESKTYLITGATSGIGLATARALAFKTGNSGARLLVHGRSPEKAHAAVSTLKQETGHPRIDPVWADLSSLSEVRSLASAVHLMVRRLDVLIHNAGVFMPTRELTPDGFETTFAVNVLAPFLLTNLLLELMEGPEESRIVTVASEAHRYGRIDLEKLESQGISLRRRGAGFRLGDDAEAGSESDADRDDETGGDANADASPHAHGKFDGHQAYNDSKLAEILLSNEFARRLRGKRISCNSLHPGVIRTKLLHAGFPGAAGSPVETGARTVLYAATSEELTGLSGKYLIGSRIEVPSVTARDTTMGARLWDAVARLVGWNERMRTALSHGDELGANQ